MKSYEKSQENKKMNTTSTPHGEQQPDKQAEKNSQIKDSPLGQRDINIPSDNKNDLLGRIKDSMQERNPTTEKTSHGYDMRAIQAEFHEKMAEASAEGIIGDPIGDYKRYVEKQEAEYQARIDALPSKEKKKALKFQADAQKYAQKLQKDYLEKEKNKNKPPNILSKIKGKLNNLLEQI